jgi:hypothetical protein
MGFAGWPLEAVEFFRGLAGSVTRVRLGALLDGRHGPQLDQEARWRGDVG